MGAVQLLRHARPAGAVSDTAFPADGYGVIRHLRRLYLAGLYFAPAGRRHRRPVLRLQQVGDDRRRADDRRAFRLCHPGFRICHGQCGRHPGGAPALLCLHGASHHRGWFSQGQYLDHGGGALPQAIPHAGFRLCHLFLGREHRRHAGGLCLRLCGTDLWLGLWLWPGGHRHVPGPGHLHAGPALSGAGGPARDGGPFL